MTKIERLSIQFGFYYYFCKALSAGMAWEINNVL